LKKLKDAEGDKEFEKEFLLLTKLNHPNIVRCLGLYSPPQSDEYYMVLEYLSKGSLLDFIRKPEVKDGLSVLDMLHMCISTASGMCYLEQEGIVHRDLAARNLLVTEVEGTYVVKISDLGLSREMSGDVYNAKDSAFPVKWSPPEVIIHRQYSSKSDVWAFMVCIWEIFSYGIIPYPALSNEDTVDYVLTGKRLPQPEKMPESIYRLCFRGWLQKPEERPSFKETFEILKTILQDEFQISNEDAVPNEKTKELFNAYLVKEEEIMYFNKK